VPQQRPVDAEQQERGRSSRALAVTPSCPDVEQCWSQRQKPAVEAFVQAAINAAANSMEPALFSEKVALENRAAVNHEQEQLLSESGIQRIEQPKCPAIGEERGAEAKNSHAMQCMESELQRIEQPMHAAVGQEHEAEANDSHAMQLMECEVQRSEQLNCAAIAQGRETKANASHAVHVMDSKFQKSEQVKRGAVGQENKSEVNDNHEVLKSSEQPKREASGQEHEAEENDRHASQPMEESGIQSSQQQKPAEPIIDEHINKLRKLPHQCALAGVDKSLPNEQKILVFDEVTGFIF
jgi:hypothetical protein